MKKWDRDQFSVVWSTQYLVLRLDGLQNGGVLAAHLVRPSIVHENWNWKHAKCGPGPLYGEHAKSPTQDEPTAVARLYEKSLEAEVTDLLDARHVHWLWTPEVCDC